MIVQHDRHSDEQQLGSLGIQRQAEEHAFKVSMTDRTVSDVEYSLYV